MRDVKRTIAGALLAAASFFPGAALDARPVTFAYQTPTLGSTLPLVAAIEAGFFAAEGLEVKPVFIIGGPTATAALIGGDVDYALIAAVPAVRAIAAGAPLVIVGGMQPYIDYTLMGAKGIATLNDLKGKVVGVTGAGGIAEFASVEGLKKKGLARDRDYRILYGVGNSPARAQALEAGRIQASPFSFMEKIELERKGFPTLFDIGQAVQSFPFVVIVSTRKKAEADPEGAVALLRGLKRGMDLVKTDPERVIAAVLKKQSYGEPATVRTVVAHFTDLYSIAITREEIENVIAAARLDTEARKLGGADKFFIRAFADKALGRGSK
ncbi:MAG TPA: ABC transporter substrate-binding protein [Candidatus Binatia bacterium]